MFGSKNRSQSKRDREALIASMPVDEDGCVPEKYLLERNGLRSKRAIIADGRSTAKKVYPSRMPPEQAASWVMNPGRYDVEGIDTRSPANVERKGAKPSKPKAPKAKAPAKPKGPIPSKDSGVIVNGTEIEAIMELVSGAGCPALALGNGECSINPYSRNCAVALTRRDGKGLFGLDNSQASGAWFYANMLYGLYDDDVYKLSFDENGNLAFRTGRSFELTVRTIVVYRNGSPYMIERLRAGSNPTNSFSPDADAFASTLMELQRRGMTMCDLASSPNGTYALSPTYADTKERVGSQVGSGSNGKGTVYARYSLEYLYPLVKTLSPYVRTAEFGQNRPLFLHGNFGDYELTGMMSPVETSGGR